jgi:hypothetical protein
MKKILVLINIIFVFCIFIVGCSNDENKAKLALDEALNNAKSILQENSLEYNEISIIYTNDTYVLGEKYSFYNLIVIIDDTYESDYQHMLNILNTLSKSDYDAELFGNKIGIMEYILCKNLKYKLDTFNNYVLVFDDYPYNSVAAKNGNDLSIEEKAYIYHWLDYYFTATVKENGKTKYKYSEEEAKSIVSDCYNISVQYLMQEIWENMEVRNCHANIYYKK